MKQKLSLEFIAGLVSGNSSFSWSTQNKDQKIASFSLKAHYNNRDLIIAVRDSLGLKEPVYEYNHQGRHYVMLIVRKRKIIENVVIPAFNGRLVGLKKKQFESWKNNFYKNKVNWKRINY